MESLLLFFFQKERGKDISRLALQFALKNNDVHTTVIGMSRLQV